MSDDWSDFGGGEWWEEWPPPPDDDDQRDISSEWDTFGEEETPRGVPPEPFDYSPPSDAFGPNHQPAEFEDALRYLLDIENISDPSMIRGTAFETLYEALSWLQALGLLGFSGVVEQSGAFFPVVGIGYEDPDGGDYDDGIQDIDIEISF